MAILFYKYTMKYDKDNPVKHSSDNRNCIFVMWTHEITATVQERQAVNLKTSV